MGRTGWLLSKTRVSEAARGLSARLIPTMMHGLMRPFWDAEGRERKESWRSSCGVAELLYGW